MRKLVDEFVSSIEREIPRLNEQLPDTDKRGGGYLCVTKVRGGIPEDAPLCIVRLGEPAKEKISKYFEFSLEKASRLSDHRDHVSSWQSRDPENSRWGGAIRAEDYILSFSGLVELADEAVLVNSAFKLGMITGEACSRIKEASGNDLIEI